MMHTPSNVRRLSHTIREIWLDAAEHASFADVFLFTFCIRTFVDHTAHLAPVHPLAIYPGVGEFHEYELSGSFPLVNGPRTSPGCLPMPLVTGAQSGESISGAYGLGEWGMFGKMIYTYSNLLLCPFIPHPLDLQ